METRDFFKRDQDLDAAGLYQLAAEEAARPGQRTEKSIRILRSLRDLLGLFDAQVREIEALAEEKRRAGTLGDTRKFSRRQLYARAIRYTHWNGDPSPANAQLLAHLRQALSFTPKDHENLLEKLIDKGWAPPRQITRRSPEEIAASHMESVQPGPVPKAPAMTASHSVDLEPPTEVIHKPPPARPKAPEQTPRVLPSTAPESAGLESMENIPLNPLETTPHLPLDRAALMKGQGPGPGQKPPDQKKQMVMGVLLGALLVALPAGLWMSFSSSGGTSVAEDDWPTSSSRPTPRPSPVATTPTNPPPEPPSLAPTPEPRPTREPPPSPTAKPPPAPVSPVEDFRKGIPESPDTPGGGLALVGWLHQELALHDVEEPSRDFRKEINASFAKRNEEIFEASQWKGTAGGFSRTYHAKSLETLRSVEDLEKIPEVVSQAYFFSLLAFYMDGKEYLLLSKQFEDLVPSLISALEKTPALARSAPGKVIRVIGEDLRDSDSEKLSVLGLNLLEALAKSK